MESIGKSNTPVDVEFIEEFFGIISKQDAIHIWADVDVFVGLYQTFRNPLQVHCEPMLF